MQGRISKIMSKRFGFIELSKEKDIFFHCSDVEGIEFDDLQEGDLVSFEITEGRDGKDKAIKVKKIEE